ncbi:MAG: type II toxin-antitoxin system VapC family toxin [Candidatus Sulfotelmatobacter sp.]
MSSDPQRFIIAELHSRPSVLDCIVATIGDLNQILSIARQNNLTEDDAAYVELALREGLPLATLDAGLRTAARHLGIALVST